MGTMVVLGLLIYQNFFQYGKELKFGNGHSVYYTSGASKEEAQKFGDSLKALGYFGDHPVSVQLAKDGDTYVARFVTVKEAWNDPEMQKNFAVVGYFINEGSFPGKPLRVELCDDHLNTKATVTPKAPETDEEATGEPSGEAANENPDQATADQPAKIG